MCGENRDLRGLYISEQEIEDVKQRQGGVAEPDEKVDLRAPDGAMKKLQGMVTRSSHRCEESLKANVRLRLLDCQKRFRLCDFERDVLLLGLMSEVDLKYEKIFGYIHDDITKKRPSVELALKLFCSTLREKIKARCFFMPKAALLSNRLMRIIEDSNHPQQALISKTFKVEEGVVNYLLESDGLTQFPAGVIGFQVPRWEIKSLPIPDTLRRAITEWAKNPKLTLEPIFYFQGPYGVGKQITAEALFREKNLKTLIIDGSICAKKERQDLDQLVMWAIRETKIQRAGLLLREVDEFLDGEREQELRRIVGMMYDQRIPVVLTGCKSWEFVDCAKSPVFLRYDFPRPGFRERLGYWRQTLSNAGCGEGLYDLEDVANRFRLTYGQIEEGRIIAQNIARRRRSESTPIVTGEIYEACRMNSNRKLYSLAQHIKPRYSWEDIVLSPDRLRQLEEIVHFVKYRGTVYDLWGFDRKLSLGKGLNTLFAGPSGTGKTMAAEVIAHELELDLYKIDLSKIVSKYIGETEKNLARIFEEAATSNAILFFDEADALFGKRSEVKDSHDRYANIEVGYLLQKMEEYEGIVILATNFRKNLDEAFVRRMHMTIDFQYPGHKERQEIWEKVWPVSTPLNQDIDLEFMATRFQLSGGNIKNVAIGAAFLAMEDGREIAMRHLLHATRREFQKMGKVLSEEEFLYSKNLAVERYP